MKKLALILVLGVVTLLLLGTVMLYSSTTTGPGLDRLYSHFCWLGLGAVCCCAAASVDYAWLRKWHLARWGMAVAIVLLLAVFVPGVGVVRNGAARWLPFGQPSEFAKLALVLFLADYAATFQARMRERNIGFLCPGAVIGLACFLVFAEQDWGTAALLALVALAMLFLSGAHWGYLLSATVIVSESFVLLLLNNPLRLERVLMFLDPEQYRDGIGWQVWHSLLSLGSGGVFGTFIGAGVLKNGYVPEQQTDFVLSLVGEELGLMGTLLILCLFMCVIVCGFRVAWRAADPFGQLLASGLTLIIGVQAFMNIGVVTSSLPNKGIALPFVSYGGSNLVCMMICLGLLLSVARRAPVLPQPLPQSHFAAATPPRMAGPVGSLLESSCLPPPRGLRRRLLRWLHLRRASRLSIVPLHDYQRPPAARNGK
jgi:cell division protein FtsW